MGMRDASNTVSPLPCCPLLSRFRAASGLRRSRRGRVGLPAWDSPAGSTRRAVAIAMPHVGRSVHLGVEVTVRRSSTSGLIGTGRSPSSRPSRCVFVDDALVDRLGTRRAPRRIDEDVVAEFANAEHIRHDVLGDESLAVRADAARENHVAVVRLRR